MEAIDFASLLKQEKRKAKAKAKAKAKTKAKTKTSNPNENKDESSPFPKNNEDAMEDALPVATTTTDAAPSSSSTELPPWLSQTETISPAIDFNSLLQEEKRNSETRNPTRLTSATQDAHEHGRKYLSGEELPPWSRTKNDMKLEQFLDLQLICSNPKSILYSSQCLPLNQLQDLQIWLQALPHGDSGLCEWKTMTFGKRRACMFGEEKHQQQNEQLVPLPPPLSQIAEQLVVQGIFPPETAPNHVLLNHYYEPGQGILPHTDGPLYHSRTATLSLTSDVVLEFTKRLASDEIGTDITISSPPLQVRLEAGSLIVFQDDAYLHYCHGIPMNVHHDTTTEHCLNAPPHQTTARGQQRFSLTFRHKKKQKKLQEANVLGR